jgi:catechol 2,3-dioxygenase
MATPEKKNVPPIDPQARMGHVHLKVADLERALGFYRDVLGFELMQRTGDQAAFLSAGGYHHHIALNTWESLGGPPPPFGHNGALSPRDRLSRPSGAGECVTAVDRSRHWS